MEDSRFSALHLLKHWDCLEFEAVFQTHLQRSLRKEKLRENLMIRLLDLPCCKVLVSPNCKCPTAALVVGLFLTLRIHHQLTLLNNSHQK
ncbi:hypothetical protein PoB_004610600 [Plakobranchus ocellatus]|uniref:Uncharacterized protein n=1 Tax=Plakobranchus ocellatus TaxID=259542 RepID=A0AAV4B881_9GAST|nr:hypothetical protein PoB_004610600 [Plakobranchus ocellatus]